MREIEQSETIAVRHSVLWPHMPLEHVILPEDIRGKHFGAFVLESPAADKIFTSSSVAVISLFHEDVPQIDASRSAAEFDVGTGSSWRFRKFACVEALQGQGIGSTLLRFVLDHARNELGARVIWCDARLLQKKWYERRGFTAFGDIFMKDGVQYVRMRVDV